MLLSGPTKPLVSRWNAEGMSACISEHSVWRDKRPHYTAYGRGTVGSDEGRIEWYQIIFAKEDVETAPT